MTFLEMQDQVLQDLDDVDAGYFTRPIVKMYLNQAQKQVQKLVEQAFEGHFSLCAETTLVIGQREYELPTDFKRLDRLEIILSGSTFGTQNVQRVAKITPNQQDQFARTGTPLGYYFKGTQLVLVPCPDIAKTLRMEYTKKLSDMVNDSDVSEVPTEYHELLPVLAQIKGLIRDARNIAEAEKKRDELIQFIMRDAEQRNVDMPRTVVQTIFDETSDDDIW